MMHVNQYVHPAERIPKEFEANDIEKWSKINHLSENKHISKYLDLLVSSF